ncbi:hypothetical protein OIU84_022604 [Salix udensis]|uniref:Uncharacterized protein n=1 Tax=Salix udensis TaxID=889485 RepID=A0AAD6KP69_9ROSI|nr:hypothetical protein OIU84_022604 [Salix udensis]
MNFNLETTTTAVYSLSQLHELQPCTMDWPINFPVLKFPINLGTMNVQGTSSMLSTSHFGGYENHRFAHSILLGAHVNTGQERFKENRRRERRRSRGEEKKQEKRGERKGGGNLHPNMSVFGIAVAVVIEIKFQPRCRELSSQIKILRVRALPRPSDVTDLRVCGGGPAVAVGERCRCWLMIGVLGKRGAVGRKRGARRVLYDRRLRGTVVVWVCDRRFSGVAVLWCGVA